MSKLWLGVRLRSSLGKLITVAAILCCLAAISTARAPNTNAQDPKTEMGTFYLCLLVKPQNWTGQWPEQQVVQAHFKHVQNLMASGKAAIAGRFTDDTRIAGVFVLNASSLEEARALEEADPLVKAAGFSVEVLKWWAAKGIMKPPEQPLKMTTYYFAFLRRGPKWTAQRTPETDKLQADHMAHINSMARSGKLVIAGPFENAGDYAGVFVFKVNSIEEAKALAESDPAVKAGRLVIDVHPWLVPQGSLP
ncbi:MAG: YciI family protein [Acidobacteriota bacterium]